MADVETQLAVITQRLDTIVETQSAMHGDVRALHNDHRALQLEVAQIPLNHIKEGEERFAPKGRFKVLERAFYGILVAAVAGALSLTIKEVWQGEGARSMSSIVESGMNPATRAHAR